MYCDVRLVYFHSYVVRKCVYVLCPLTMLQLLGSPKCGRKVKMWINFLSISGFLAKISSIVQYDILHVRHSHVVVHLEHTLSK